MKPLPRVIYKKLPRAWDCWGVQTPGILHIEKNQPPKDALDALVHELLHDEFPDLSEEAVTRSATRMARVLWREGYRRVKQ